MDKTDAEAMLKVQTRVTNNIINFLKNTKSKKGPALQTATYYEARLKLLQKYFDDLYSRHELLLPYEQTKKDDDYFAKNGFELAESSYVEAVAELSADIEKIRSEAVDVANQARVATQRNQDSVKLPRVTLPTFSGKPGEWESFKQRFSSLIFDKRTHSDVDKLQYLIGTLEGKAAKRLQNIEIVGENFKVAWDLLEKRYGNQRRCLETHLENLIQLKPIRPRNAQDISDLLDTVEVTVRALQKLGCDTESYNHWFVHCIVRTLDSHTKETWKISQESKQGFYKYNDLISFLESRMDSLDSEKDKRDTRTAGGPTNKSNDKNKQPKTPSTAVHTAELSNSAQAAVPRPQSCALCQANHSLNSCDQFNAMNTQQRFDFCKKSKLCLNCLRKAHTVSDCKSTFRCLTCKQKHHSKLHFGNSSPVSATPSEEETRTDANSASVSTSENPINAHLATVKHTVLLATASILVADSFGNTISIRALIDPGAQRSFITDRLIKQLTIERNPTSVSILGVGGQASAQATGEATILIRSRLDRNFNCSCNALILPKLTRLLPSRNILCQNWPHLEGLQLADPAYASPAAIDMILGADLYGLILLDGSVRGPADAPIAQRTVFGWILTGIVDAKSLDPSNQATAYHLMTDSSLDQLLPKFWEIEDLPVSRKLTPQEEYCEAYFADTYYRNADGRFVVRLPFARREPFVDSRDIAVACLLRSEKRRKRAPELHEAYAAFMKEYEQLNHMQAAPPLSNDHYSYFLPHHAVFRPGSSKIRVVFNASQKCAAGYSLNDLFYPGPKLQTDITLVITLWRFFRIAMFTDIVKFFRQFLVHPDDRAWLRLVWREDPTSPIQDYQATTVTYGTSCASFLAIRAIIQLARDGQKSHAKAAFLLLRLTYIDDVFLGDDDEAAVQALRNELIDLLASAGMSLGKWSSNTPELLHDLTDDDVIGLPTSSGDTVSTLGLQWNTRADVFQFEAKLPAVPTLISKRSVLSDTARLFDPLGFIGPILIQAKILLQDLWIHRLDWDDPLPSEFLERWLSFRSSLLQLSQIRIPRWIGVDRHTSWHLHGFADASKRAYAAVVYAVIPGSSATILMAKTKVAPVRVETIPRLELCIATLLVRLAKHLIDGMVQRPTTTNFWSDSKVVLDWLKSHPSRWPTFVANRVSQISSSFPDATWRHVPSGDNPADCASRGMSPQELARLTLWWEGPSWLPQEPKEWPAQPPASHENSQVLSAVEATDGLIAEEFLESIQKFSNFSKLIRILAYCLRWRFKRAKDNEIIDARLTAREITYAKQSFFKLIQLHFFASDIESIRRNNIVSPKSALARLSPFVDDEGLLRVGGRLQNAALPYAERHPIILPGRCIFTKRLVEEAHRLTLHGGVQLMKSFINRNFWIIRGNRLFTAVYHNCPVCIRFGSRPVHQQMAPLPADRLVQGRPFAITGLDFAGPFPILFSKGRGAKSTKGYVAIFICLAIKAVHLEVVSDLTTEAFIAAFSRFTARRGLCSVIHSDNGTTFKGADAELQRLFRQTSDFAREVSAHLAARGIEWKFIPPRAPHFGGLWEAAVRSFKHHLRRVVGQTTFTFEEFAILVTKIEACLNSRPLCPLSNEANDPVALTPGHFLVGSAPLAYPEPIQDLTKSANLQKRWQLLNRARDSFWVRWRKEVLCQLQQRTKWLKPQPNLSEGELVILKDDLTPPATWPLAIITKTHPGDDKKVRVVTLRTATTHLVRPVVSLLRIPPDDAAAITHAHYTATLCTTRS